MSFLDESAEDDLWELRRSEISGSLRHVCGKTLAGGFASMVESWVKRWKSIKEPLRNDRLAKLVRGPGFNSLCMLIIILNAIFIWNYTNVEFENLEYEGTSESMWIYMSIDRAFLAFYATELMLKLIVHRQYFFCNSELNWNIFDFILVFFSAAGQIFVITVKPNQDASMQSLRILRLLRVVKVLRFVKTYQYFGPFGSKNLVMMLGMLVGSIRSLFWCLVMFACIVYPWSILLMQLLVVYLDDPEANQLSPGDSEDLNIMFGTVGRSCVTLVQAPLVAWTGMRFTTCFLLKAISSPTFSSSTSCSS